MKSITVPSPVEVCGPKGQKIPEVGFHTMYDYLINWPLGDLRFGAAIEAVEANIEIRQAFAIASPGDDVCLSDEAYELLNGAVTRPQQPTPPFLAVQYIHFMRAIRDAKDVEK